mmetsp:Transcript_2496/g.6213  ORF Transcript_2496/g.6213 Transcript_2496/m.6213 type:complete len:220 (-) Transcript_2496:88-747(-)
MDQFFAFSGRFTTKLMSLPSPSPTRSMSTLFPDDAEDDEFLFMTELSSPLAPDCRESMVIRHRLLAIMCCPPSSAPTRSSVSASSSFMESRESALPLPLPLPRPRLMRRTCSNADDVSRFSSRTEKSSQSPTATNSLLDDDVVPRDAPSTSMRLPPFPSFVVVVDDSSGFRSMQLISRSSVVLRTRRITGGVAVDDPAAVAPSSTRRYTNAPPRSATTI